ncbi:MAG: DUF4258 domain-containing protein [Candidatus Omnitrophica bacterium]|nr:DUF4258 domain-containing protein [Candidatus Omnitrophota bacterium]
MSRRLQHPEKKWLFVVQSRLPFVVRTTRTYWALITTVKHPQLAGQETAVVRTLTEPNEVRVSKRDGSVYLFYKKHGRRYLCVVTKRFNQREAFIMTAYVTEAIKEGRVVWKR